MFARPDLHNGNRFCQIIWKAEDFAGTGARMFPRVACVEALPPCKKLGLNCEQ